MAHHGKHPFEMKNSESLNEAYKKVLAIQSDSLGLGPTGKFPEGKLAEHDEGEIKIAVSHHKGKVVIDFGGPVAFIGFTPDQAVDIADLITKHAKLAEDSSA